MRSSLVTAYLAAVGTTVWATYAELDRSPRPDLPIAAEPSEAKPRVPDQEWRAWTRQQVGLQKHLAALMTVQATPPADLAPGPAPDAAPLAAPAPRSAIPARTAWSPPAPALKPVRWSDDRRLLLAVDLTEEPTEPPTAAEPESFWSRVLTLLEPASAATLEAGRASDERNTPATRTAAVERSVAERRSGQSGTKAGRDAEAEASATSDADASSERSTGNEGRSSADRSSRNERSASSDRSVDNDRSVADDRSARSERGFGGLSGGLSARADRSFGDRSVAADRGRDRDDRGGRGGRDDRDQRDGRGDRGDGDDRGDRGDRDRGRD